MEQPVHVIICPPLADFKEQPSDISKCQLYQCPECKLHMWLSDKKKKYLMEAIENKIEHIFCCYRCFTEMVYKSPEHFKRLRQVNI